MENKELLDTRKTALEDILLRLLNEMPYTQITVPMIIGELGLCRKTFYRVFPCKDALLESLISRFVLNCHRYVQLRQKDSVDLMASYTDTLQYWKENKSFLDCINRNDLGSFFMKQCIRHLETEERYIVSLLDTPGVECDEDILLFYVAGTTVLVMHWVRCGCQTPVEKLARKLVRLNHTRLLNDQ